MPKTAGKAPESRCKRIEGACAWCGSSLPDGSRKDRKFCSEKCRYQAFQVSKNTGTVYRCQLLKNKKVSIVIHVDEANLTAGDEIRWEKL